MKIWGVLAIACAILVAAPAALAEDATAETAKEKNALKYTGKVTAFDAAKKTVSLQDKQGETRTFTWTGDIKIQGEPAVGKTVRVRYEEGSNGAVQVLSLREMAEEPKGRRAAAQKQTTG